MKAVHQTKRIRKTYSDVDLWLDEYEGEIKNLEMNRLENWGLRENLV